MDLDPVSYRVMGKEMNREAKVELVGNPNTVKLSDARNYLFVEYDIDVDLGGDVLRAYAIVGGVTYGSDHFSASRVAAGIARTAVELPPGTTLADVTELGMQGIGTMSGTLHRLEAFILESDFLPGTRSAFNGALFQSGSNPSWALAP
jgi:hypothetical protein